MWVEGLLVLTFVSASIQAPFYNNKDWFNDCGRSMYPDAGRPNPGFKRSLSQRIVNGWDAREGEFPWQASLRRGTSLMCGAVVINNDWLLTAAHCTDWETPSNLNVVVGDHVRSQTSTNQRTYQIESIIQHPGYDETGEIENDVSLLKTTVSMEFSEYVRAACKPSGNYGGRSGTTSGWGRTGDWDPLADTLQYANNPIMQHQTCHSCFPNDSDILPGMLCFGSCGTNTQSTCNGDSGGPMIVQREDGSERFEVVGLTSWGMGGCLSQYPPVFTNVSYFNDWIDRNLPSTNAIEQESTKETTQTSMNQSF